MKEAVHMCAHGLPSKSVAVTVDCCTAMTVASVTREQTHDTLQASVTAPLGLPGYAAERVTVPRSPGDSRIGAVGNGSRNAKQSLSTSPNELTHSSGSPAKLAMDSGRLALTAAPGAKSTCNTDGNSSTSAMRTVHGTTIDTFTGGDGDDGEADAAHSGWFVCSDSTAWYSSGGAPFGTTKHDSATVSSGGTVNSLGVTVHRSAEACDGVAAAKTWSGRLPELATVNTVTGASRVRLVTSCVIATGATAATGVRTVTATTTLASNGTAALSTKAVAATRPCSVAGEYLPSALQRWRVLADTATCVDDCCCADNQGCPSETVADQVRTPEDNSTERTPKPASPPYSSNAKLCRLNTTGVPALDDTDAEGVSEGVADGEGVSDPVAVKLGDDVADTEADAVTVTDALALGRVDWDDDADVDEVADHEKDGSAVSVALLVAVRDWDVEIVSDTEANAVPVSLEGGDGVAVEDAVSVGVDVELSLAVAARDGDNDSDSVEDAEWLALGLAAMDAENDGDSESDTVAVCVFDRLSVDDAVLEKEAVPEIVSVGVTLALRLAVTVQDPVAVIESEGEPVIVVVEVVLTDSDVVRVEDAVRVADRV